MRKKRLAITFLFLCFFCLAVSFPSLWASAEWETMQFGSYPQSKVTNSTTIAALNALSTESGVTVTYGGNQYVSKASNGSLNWYLVEPITWIILQKDGDTAFVMSEKILDACALNGKWSDSTARTFLNKTFYETAFTAKEQACITTSVIQYTNGDTTEKSTDKLFYPSREELQSSEYGFSSAANRSAEGTKYSGQGEYLTRDAFSVLFGQAVFEYAVYGSTGRIVYVSAGVEWGARPCMRVNYTQANALGKAEKYNLANAAVTLSKSSYTYDGSEKMPGVTVKYNGTKLTKGTDYTVSYKNNVNAGTATVTITGTGNYEGSITKTFSINKASQTISARSVSSSVKAGKTTQITADGIGDITFSSNNTSVATVSSSGIVTAKKPGTVKITVKAAGNSNYSAAIKSITIKVTLAAGKISSLTNTSSGVKIKWSKITGASGYYIYRKTASGSYEKIKTIKDAATLSYTDTSIKTQNGVTYTYKVVPYSGSTKGSFKTKTIVRLTGTTLSTVKNTASKKATVKWTDTTKVTGYQIQYSTSKTFASGNKAIKISGAGRVSKVLSKLKKGKTYYVRIRTYKTVSGTTYYSAWSSKKSVKITK